jgi:phasin family protein
MAGSNRETGAQSDAMAAAGRRGARGMADAVHAATEAAEGVARSGMDVAARSIERSTSPFMEAFAFTGPVQDMARQSSRNLQVMTQCGTVLARGMQDITRAWLGVTQDGLQRCLDGCNALTRARSLEEFMTLQTDLVRNNFETMVNGSRQVVELSAQVAEEAAQTVTKQVQETATRANRSA